MCTSYIAICGTFHFTATIFSIACFMKMMKIAIVTFLLFFIISASGPLAAQTINESSLPQELPADTMLISTSVTVETDVPADLVIDILGQGDFHWHGGTRVSVAAGTDVVDFEVPIFNPFSEGGGAFWKLTLTEPGGDWRTTFAYGSWTGIEIAQTGGEEGGLRPNLATLAVPTSVEPDATYSINIAYQTAEAASLNLQLISDQGGVIASGSVDVEMGEGVQFIPVTIPTDSSGSFSYEASLVSTETESVLTSSAAISGVVTATPPIEHNTDLAKSTIFEGENLPFFYQISSADNFELVYHVFDTGDGNRWVDGSRISTSGSTQTISSPIDLEALPVGEYEIDTYVLAPGGTWRDKLSIGRRIAFSIVEKPVPLLDGGELTFRQTWFPRWGFEEDHTLDRRAIVKMPTRRASESVEKHPVTILLHGSSGNPEHMINWHGYLTSHILVGCEGFRKDWNISFDATHAPDVDFIRRLILELRTYDNVDTENITILGYSNGSSLLNRLMIELEDGLFQNAIGMGSQLRFIQYNNGQFWHDPNGIWDYSEPIVPASGRRFLYMHGAAEEVLDIEGVFIPDPSIEIFMPVLDSMNAWAKALGGDDARELTAADAVEDDEGYTYNFVDGLVEYYLIKDANHGMATPERNGDRMVEKIAEFLDIVPWE